MEFFIIQAMIKELNLQGYVGPVRFTFYTSYSPCANCANNFVMLRNAILYLYRCDITIEIVAAAPYKTYSVSCPMLVKRYFFIKIILKNILLTRSACKSWQQTKCVCEHFHTKIGPNLLSSLAVV